MNLGARTHGHEAERNERNAIRDTALDGEEYVSNAHAGSHGGAFGKDIGNNDAVAARKIEGRGEDWRNGLQADANLGVMNVTEFAKLLIRDVDDAAGNGKSTAFVSAGLRKDDSVVADDVAVDIDERTSGIAGIDGSVGLDVDHGRVWIDLASNGGNDAKCDGVAQPLGATEGENDFSLADIAVRCEGERAELYVIDLEHSKVNVLGDADNTSRD